MKYLLHTLSAVFLASTVAGCGGASQKGAENRPQTFPVKGVLTHKGKPVENAQINFVPDSTQASAAYALTSADGSFELTTFEQGDGAPVGQYKVTVAKQTVETKLNPADPSAPPLEVKTTSHLPKKYSSTSTTNIVIEVPEGGKSDLTIELKD